MVPPSQSGRPERPATPEVRPPGSPITGKNDRNRRGDRAAAREGSEEAAGWPSGQPEGEEPDRSGGPEELERFGATATRGLLAFSASRRALAADPPTDRHGPAAPRNLRGLVTPGVTNRRNFGPGGIGRRARKALSPGRPRDRFWGQVWGRAVDFDHQPGDLAKSLDHDPASARWCPQASQDGRSGRRHRRFVHRGHRSPARTTGTGEATEPPPERAARKPPGGPRVNRRARSPTDREAPRSWSASAQRLLGAFSLFPPLGGPWRRTRPPTGTARRPPGICVDWSRRA